jgi:hypothetical protein
MHIVCQGQLFRIGWRDGVHALWILRHDGWQRLIVSVGMCDM